MSDAPNNELRAIFNDGGRPSLESVVNETRQRMDQETGKDLGRERAELAQRLRTGRVGPENKPLLDLAGVVGLGCILLGAASMAFTTGVHPASLGLVGLGILLLGAYAVMDWGNVRRMLTSRSTMYSANLSITLGILLGIVVVVNLLANRYYQVMDLTQTQINSLSPQSIELMKTLRESGREITVTAFYPKDADSRTAVRVLEDTFARYVQRNPQIKFAVVDPDVNKKLAEDKGITKAFTILFEAGENETRINSFDEPSITGAFMKVTNPESKVIYFMTGHNEFRTTSEDNDGLKKLGEFLGKENFLIKELSIPKENGVPADAAAVVLIRPTVTPLQNQETTALRDYLDRGGNLMVLIEPFQAPEVAAWLQEYGLQARTDMVIDTDSNEFNEATVPILEPFDAEHPLIPMAVMTSEGESGIPLGVVTPSARSLSLSSGKATWTPLYGTASVASFGETDQNSDAPSFTDGTDIPGPLTIFAAGQISGSEVGGRLFVGGDAQWLTNANIAKQSNRDFAVNSIAWLVGSEQQIAIRPKLASNDRANLKGNDLQVVSATIFGIPILVAAMGVAIWWRRRTW